MDRPACIDARQDEPPSGAVKEAMKKRLLAFSPRIEQVPGRLAFWLDADGVTPLYPSLFKWTEAVLSETVKIGFRRAAAVSGFTKFGTAAISRTVEGSIVFNRLEDERASVAKIPLQYFELSPKTLRCLLRLDICTLGDLIRFPQGELFARFGDEVRRLRENAKAILWDPLQPIAEEAPIIASRELDHPEHDTARLAFIARRLILSLVEKARLRHFAVLEIVLSLSLDHAPPLCESIKPWEPTLDDVQLTELVRLRLEGLHLSAGVTGVSMKAVTSSIAKEQLELFAQKPRRDKAAADRALARVRAELGEDAVVKASLRDGHLPEACFAFVPVTGATHGATHGGRRVRSKNETRPVALDSDRVRCLVRRIYTKPIPLQARPVVGPGGCHFLGMGDDPAVDLEGPYIISGGWWNNEIHREYYFATAKTGRVLWVYFDRCRRCWFLHGEVE
jgi:protein ImuB